MEFLPDEKVKCPYTGFQRTCRDIVVSCACPKFVKISGANPNDGQPVDKFGCIDSFTHMLMIENSQQQRQTAAAVESFRNKFVVIGTSVLVRAGVADEEIRKLYEDVPAGLIPAR